MGAVPANAYSPGASTFEDRLKEVLIRVMAKVGPETKAQLQSLIAPESLEIMAGVLVAWIVAHAFGLGEIIDAILLAGGAIAIGWAIFDGIDHLYDFASLTYKGRSSGDFERAADHLAKAITILGIQTILAVLFKGAKNPRTGRMNPGAAPPKTPGLRYKPKTIREATGSAGAGFTSWWGDITISTKGSQTDSALVLLHEKVHQFLVPKLYVLREYRVANRVGSYVRSSLYRYIEEMLAETIAQVGVNGFRQLFVGLRFPVKNGYVLLMKAGSSLEPSWKGSGVLVEGAALIRTGLVAAFGYEIWFVPGNP
ncbi:MAG: hypothetical protein ABUS79_01865 [Pseudomonadota bacterium]